MNYIVMFNKFLMQKTFHAFVFCSQLVEVLLEETTLSKGPEVNYHLTHKMTNKFHNYPVKLHLRRICHISFTK
jgi:hypothetical protein